MFNQSKVKSSTALRLQRLLMNYLKHRLFLMIALLLTPLMISCTNPSTTSHAIAPEAENIKEVVSSTQEVATFAGGCFWCVEAPFEGVDGVISVISGYAGGKEKNPTYSEVSGGQTSHRESVQITYDPEIISYAELVDIFWQTFDPTDVGGSFFDRGSQYESAIFFHNEEQKKVAEESKKRLDQSKRFLSVSS